MRILARGQRLDGLVHEQHRILEEDGDEDDEPRPPGPTVQAQNEQDKENEANEPSTEGSVQHGHYGLFRV